LPSGAEQQNGVYGRVFYHLVGNVAEIVTDSPGQPPYSIIGGSVFSNPNVPVDQAIPLNAGQEKQAWPDVGFRLAFTPPATPLRDLVTAALDSKAAQFLPD